MEVASKPGSEGCAGDNKFLCPITCGLCELCPETSSRVSLSSLQQLSRGGCPAPVGSPAPTTEFVLCDWNGVGCHSRDETEISIVFGVSGTIPSEIGELTALTRLHIVIATITGTIPTEIGLLTDLEHLAFYVNSLSGTIPSEIGYLTSVGYMSLNGNDLAGPIPSEIGLMAALTDLYLGKRVFCWDPMVWR